MPPRGMSKTVREENTCQLTGRGKIKLWVNFKLCIDYVENTPDYVEILTVDKIDNKAFPVYLTTVERKTLQSLNRRLSS